MRRSVLQLVGVGLFGSLLGAAQEGMVPTAYLEQLFEQLAEQQDGEPDVSDWLERIMYFEENPLNLNAATQEELKQLFILNDFQIAVLQDYIHRQGAVRSVYELGYLPGFRPVDVERLARFVVCGDVEVTEPTLLQQVHKTRQELLIREQQVLEVQEGYKPLPDSVLEDQPDKARYLGAPQKLYTRYNFDAAGHLQGSVLLEKDAGEEFFQGSNPKGFDFGSVALGYTRKQGLLRQVVLGDYHLQAGQGLLLWSSYAFAKPSRLMALSRQAEVLRINRSAEENRFFRGAAATIGGHQFSCTTFISSKAVDAAVSDTNDAYFTSRMLTGYHATPSEITNENRLKEQVAGMSVQYRANRLSGGCQWFYEHLNKEPLPGDALYQSFYSAGSDQTGLSGHYRYMAERVQFFGETARANRAWATVNGMLFFLNQDLNLGLLYRKYSERYDAPWSNAFAENSRAMNEEGLFWGVESRIGQSQINGFIDVFAFPWLRYRVNTPSEGYELAAEWLLTTATCSIQTRLKHEQKPQNATAEENLYSVELLRKDQFQMRYRVTMNDHLESGSRCMLARTGYTSDSSRLGVFLSQDFRYSPRQLPLQGTVRIAWFHTPDYNTRFYVYEDQVLYAGGVQMYYGTGWRMMGLVRYRLRSHISCWCKVGYSYFPGETALGSGLSRIQANHKTEVTFQLQYRWQGS